MTARDDYPTHEQTLADADRSLGLAKELLSRATPLGEGSPGWLYLTKARRLPADKVRAALGELRALDPLIEGRDAADYAVVSLLRGGDDAVSGLQLTFHDVLGAPSAKAPKRQSYSLRPNGVRDGLFYAGGGEGSRAFITEGRLEKSIALASLGLGPVYGAGGRTILGCASPPEPEVVIISDRRPGGDAGTAHDRDMKRACDLLQLAGKTVFITDDPPCQAHPGGTHCADADAFLVRHGEVLLEEWARSARQVGGLSMDGEARRVARIVDPLERDAEATATAKRLRVRVGEFREAVRKHRDGEADSPAGQALRVPSSKQTRAILGRGGLVDPDEAELVAIAAAGALLDGWDKLKLAALWRRASSAE